MSLQRRKMKRITLRTIGGTKLREVRNAAGTSLLELAAKLDDELGKHIDAAHINKIERGSIKKPLVETLEAILAGLNANYRARRDVLEAFGYTVPMTLPTELEIAEARRLLALELHDATYPMCVIDHSQRFWAWNRYMPHIIGLHPDDPAITRFAGVTIFDVTFNPVYETRLLIDNPDEYLPAMLQFIRRSNHMPVDLVPFQDDLVVDAAELLAQRHAHDRQVLPDLPPQFADLAGAHRAIEAVRKRPHASGIAAIAYGRLLGYLIGDMVFDAAWGRQAWVRLPGYALAPDQPPDLIHDLYATLSAHWVSYGCFEHFALVPVADSTLIDAWFRLSFGLQQIHALLALDGLELPPPMVPPGITIRQAVQDDRATLADLSDLIWRHQTRAPVWGIHLPETDAEVRAGWAELVDDPTVVVWLACENGQAVGSQGYWPADATDEAMHIPEQCARMSVAGIREMARGRGIMPALTHHGLAQARERGYHFCETDWRSTNLLAARFWPRQGFRPTAYRLVRRLDERIAWADAKDEG